MFLPKQVQKIAERNNIYVRFRYSKWVYNLWLLLRSDVRKDIAAKKKFYGLVIPSDCKLIFDIGANEGVMTEIFSRLSQRVIAVEPSARNVKILSARFDTSKAVTIEHVAVSNQTGKQVWYEDENDYAMGTLSSKWNDSKEGFANSTTAYISTVTLDDLIRQFGAPQFIKIDVEGNEWQALKGLSQPIPLLSFEAILPQFLDETIACINQVLSLQTSAVFNYSFHNKLVYQSYQDANILLSKLPTICETIDIFCKM